MPPAQPRKLPSMWRQQRLGGAGGEASAHCRKGLFLRFPAFGCLGQAHAAAGTPGAGSLSPGQRHCDPFVKFRCTSLQLSMNARTIVHNIRLVTVTMLALLLTLAPFVHGHLGQPVQQGWHIHAGPLELGGGRAPLASPNAQGPGNNSGLLLAHESAAVEVSVGPSALRVLRIASAHTPAPAPQPWLRANPAHAAVLARQRAAACFGHANPQPACPASRGAPGLPPPAHAPPLFLA